MCAPTHCSVHPLAECGLTSLPAGPYLHGLAELAIDGNTFQPRRSPIPAPVGSATGLASLTVSLDGDVTALEEQWPQVEASWLMGWADHRGRPPGVVGWDGMAWRALLAPPTVQG